MTRPSWEEIRNILLFVAFYVLLAMITRWFA